MQLSEVFIQDNYWDVLEWFRALVLAQSEIIQTEIRYIKDVRCTKYTKITQIAFTNNSVLKEKLEVE